MPLSAQIDINSSNRVGIGATPHSTSKLYIYSSSTNSTGIRSTSSGSTTYRYGVLSSAGGSGNHHRGIYGTAVDGSSSNYGVYGSASGTNSWAGYFSGSVYTTGSYSSSDQRLKKNIVDLETSGMLNRLDLLKPKMY